MNTVHNYITPTKSFTHVPKRTAKNMLATNRECGVEATRKNLSELCDTLGHQEVNSRVSLLYFHYQ